MNEKTMQSMKEMRLYGMHRAFTTTMETGGPSTGYTNDELIAYLVQSEWDDRHNRRIERLTKSARFRYTAVMEAIDYRPSRQLDKNLVRRLGSCGFIQKGRTYLLPVVPAWAKVTWHRPSATRPVPWGQKRCTSILRSSLPCSRHQRQTVPIQNR